MCACAAVRHRPGDSVENKGKSNFRSGENVSLKLYFSHIKWLFSVQVVLLFNCNDN